MSCGPDAPVHHALWHLLLVPAGNGKWEHIGDKVPLPEAIPLKDGVYEVGRSEPADIVLNIPTVSGRHALLRVGESAASRGLLQRISSEQQAVGWLSATGKRLLWDHAAGSLGLLLCVARCPAVAATQLVQISSWQAVTWHLTQAVCAALLFCHHTQRMTASSSRT